MPSYEKDQILDKFAETFGCLLSANIALPVPRINHAYLAIDNFLSVMLMIEEIEPSHNHKSKIEQFNDNFPKILEDFTGFQTLDEDRLTWHKSRYESEEIDRKIAERIFNLAKISYEIGVKEICSKYNITRQELEQELVTRSEKKFYFVNLTNALATIWKQAEQYVSEAPNENEAIKRMVTDFRNMIAIEATTDDEVVTEVLESGAGTHHLDQMAQLFSKYILFNIISKRYSDERIDNVDIMDFRLRINLRFEGKDIEEIEQFIKNKHIIYKLKEMANEGSDK